MPWAVLWGIVTEAGDRYLHKGTGSVAYQAAASQRRLCRFKGGKGRETGRRPATTACAAIHFATPHVDLHPTHLHFLEHVSGGIVSQPAPFYFFFLTSQQHGAHSLSFGHRALSSSLLLTSSSAFRPRGLDPGRARENIQGGKTTPGGQEQQHRPSTSWGYMGKDQVESAYRCPVAKGQGGQGGVSGFNGVNVMNIYLPSSSSPP